MPSSFGSQSERDGCYHYPYFTDEEIQHTDLSKVTGLVSGGPQIQTRCSGSRVTLSPSVQYKAHCNGTCFAVIDKGQFIQCQTVERVLSKGTRTLTYLRSLFSTQRYYELLQSKLVLTISLWSAKYRMSLPMFSQMENMRCREGKWLI